jgi:hypothetical protein
MREAWIYFDQVFAEKSLGGKKLYNDKKEKLVILVTVILFYLSVIIVFIFKSYCHIFP